MLAIGTSVLLALLGAVTTRAAVGRLGAAGADRDPHVYWGLGFAALVPAWLVVFLALLGPTARPRPGLVPATAWILSASAGLIGAIASEGWLRRAGEGAGSLAPSGCWRLGLLGALPAWVLAAAGYALVAARA
ncbi:MAG TPA: hypothetical protein VNK50_01610 [Calidithermus sp.]|nr:hypothetical protein [Calidithermus sp.]